MSCQMSLKLLSNLALNRTLPKEYNLQVTNRASSNTIVFTEKDLPGFNSKLKSSMKQMQDSASLPFSQATPRPHIQDRGRTGSSRVDKSRRLQAYYRKAIPSIQSLLCLLRRIGANKVQILRENGGLGQS